MGKVGLLDQPGGGVWPNPNFLAKFPKTKFALQLAINVIWTIWVDDFDAEEYVDDESLDDKVLMIRGLTISYLLKKKDVKECVNIFYKEEKS